MLGSPAGPGGASQRGLWPLAPAPAPPVPNFSADSFGRYGVYSLFPGGPSIGGALYSHASTIGRFASGIPPTSGPPFHTSHKESYFSSGGYTFGSPTPPPGSPYSPVAATHQLELLTKGYNSNIIIHQPDYSLSPKKYTEKRCDEKCYSVKSEKQCSCQNSPVKQKPSENSSGCSRTNPIDWNLSNVKKEPLSTPCQVAEITTSVSPVIKIEVTSPSQKNSDLITSVPSISTTNGNISVGIAMARQRIHQQDIVSSPSLPPAGLLTTVNTTTHIKEFSRLSEIESSPGMAASSPAGVAGGGAVLQCTEDRTAGLAGWSVGGSHNSTIATPTLWQYPAALPVEPMVPLPVPPMGVQLVRDPTSGHLLLLPTTGIEHVQQAVVWPSYHQPPSLFIPPLAPPPLQLLSSASSDYLSTSTTLHQHTQTHSTRLLALTTDTKRKLPIPATTLIKIETDASNLDQTKALQAVSTISSNTGTVYTDQNMAPLVTTHVIYQHPTNLVLSQTSSSEASCRSQATSPVSYLTPPPEINLPIEDDVPGVQDASNQTDTPLCSEDDNTSHTTICEVLPDAKATMTKENVEENSVVPEKPLQSPKCDEEILDASTQPEIVDSSTETSEVQIFKPDLSGLELLSNSIVEFEENRNNLNISDKLIQCETGSDKQNDKILQGIQDMSIKDIETETVIKKAVDDKLGGLELLCALAEQRFNEEKNNAQKEKSKDRDIRREKRKARHADESFLERKKFKSEHRKRHEERKIKREFERSKKLFRRESREIDNCSETNPSDKCFCEGVHRTYRSRESEEEARKFIASKSQSTVPKENWPEMNLLELNMRIKLADLQRQYKEKQKELIKLKPKRKSLDEKEAKKIKSRKKSTFSERIETPPPPVLDNMNVPVTPNKCELLKPPTLCAITNQNGTQSMTISTINSEDKSINKESYYSSGPDFSDSSPEKIFTSSSKKRKVGRPKKLLSTSGELTATETIVAKKPKSGSFVSYLLAAKQKLQTQTKDTPIFTSASPPRYVDETKKSKVKKAKNGSKKFTETVSCKIRPKLKAEPMVKAYLEEDEFVNDWEEMEVEEPSQEFCQDDDFHDELEESNTCEEFEIPLQEKSQDEDEVKEDLLSKPKDNKCVLTEELLDKEKMRVLTAMGGLFYAGHLNAVEPPDVYSIILDGERGNRPHIMSREEILRDAIVEVAPSSTTELGTGTRVCAYWSQQYRCLYPGTVAEPGTPDPSLDSKFVSVEFDDGDSGRISIEDIRYLPSDYPFVEYDPNPLLSLSKRRRRVSSLNSVSLDERRISCSSTSQSEQGKAKPNEVDKENENENNLELLDAKHQERKRLKKKKREKLKEKLNHDDKKRRRKCKCEDEECSRKKHHRRHRKHKKRYHVELMDNEENAVQDAANEDNLLESTELISEEQDTFSENSLISEIELDVVNIENEVTIDDILNSKTTKKLKKRDRQESSESRSKMTAFLHKKQFWSWAGKSYKKSKVKGRTRKDFFKEICRDKESIMVGDSAVFLSTSSPERPYIGRIQAMWESAGSMAVKVKWFYHPEETTGCPTLHYPGGLFESPHEDENDVQTISHKCEVLPLKEFKEKLGDDSKRYTTIYDNNDIYYLAGYYDPGVKSLKMQPDIPCN